MAKRRFKILNPCDVINACPSDDGIINDTYMGNYTIVFPMTGGIPSVGDLVSITGLEEFGIETLDVVSVINVSGINVSVINIWGVSIPATIGVVLNVVQYTDVNPKNFSATKYSWEKDNNEIFFIKKLNGTLTFLNDKEENDFDYFKNYVLTNPCCKVTFIVEKLCDSGWIEEFKGYFTHSMCEWDFSKCKVVTPISQQDDYSCLLDNKGKEINVLPETSVSNMTIPYEISVEEYECCVDIDWTCIGLTLRTPPCTSPDCCFDYTPGSPASNPFVYDNIDYSSCAVEAGFAVNSYAVKKMIICDLEVDAGNYEGSPSPCSADDLPAVRGNMCITLWREYIITLDTNGTPTEPDAGVGNAWVNVGSTIINGFSATKWARPPYYGFNWRYPSSTQITMYCTGTDPNRCVVFDSTSNYVLPPVQLVDIVRDFKEVTEYVVNKTCGKINGVVSDFLEINPIGDTPGYTAGQNYVTAADNKLSHIKIVQTSDLVYPSATQHAFIGILTFEKLMNIYRILFNAYWFIDSSKRLRIEHFSWFNGSVNVNTTSGIDNVKYNSGNKKFSFDTTRIPVREEFKLQYVNNIDFRGRPIVYNGYCSDKSFVQKNELSFISTDVSFIILLIDPRDLDGFVLMVEDAANPGNIDRELGLISGNVMNNAHLSWANLHYNYHRHGRWLMEGSMNDIQQTFLSAKRTKRQKNVIYKGDCCDVINPNTDLVTTEIGNGQIDKMEMDNKTDLYSFEILFD